MRTTKPEEDQYDKLVPQEEENKKLQNVIKNRPNPTQVLKPTILNRSTAKLHLIT